jgi:hypothetical protein
MSARTVPADHSRPPGVRLLGSQLVTQPILAADGGARIVRIIGGREGAASTAGVRVVRSQARSIGTRAGIRIIGRTERPVPRAGIRVIGGQDAR